MHIILTGATGLIGTGVLACMLKQPSISKITILSRRPVRFADDANDPRVNVIIHRDFSNYEDSSLQEQLRDARGCVWALGSTSTSTVDKEEYVRATKEYAVSAARAFGKLGGVSEREPFRFVYVSGEGATQSPGLTTSLYAKVKGEAEKELAEVAEEMSSLMVIAPRPGAVDSAPHKEIHEYLPKPILMHKIVRTWLMTPIRVGYKSMYGSTEMLGNVYTRLVSLPALLHGSIEMHVW